MAAAGGGVSERGSPPERDRRRPVTRPLLLRGPPHDPGGAGQGQAVRSTRVPKPHEGRTPLQHLGDRKAVCGGWGTPPPHSTASSLRWPGRDCLVRARRRPARRSPPPLQGAPRSSRLLGAVAALLGRARLGSSPEHSHPFSHLWLAQNGGGGGDGGEGVTAAG